MGFCQEGSILKRIAVAFLIFFGLLAALGAVSIGLEYIGLDSGSLRIFGLAGMLVAILAGAISLFNERLRNLAGGLLLFLLGLPFGLAPLIFIYCKIVGISIDYLEQYTFVSQLFIVLLILPVFGLALMISGGQLFRKARKGQRPATP
jgi:hypothetical protein